MNKNLYSPNKDVDCGPRFEQHEWVRWFHLGYAVAARCKRCQLAPIEWLDRQPMKWEPRP